MDGGVSVGSAPVSASPAIQVAGLGKRYQDALKQSVAIGLQLLAAEPVPAADAAPDVTNR